MVGFGNSHAVQINQSQIGDRDRSVRRYIIADGGLVCTPDINDYLITRPQTVIRRSSQIHTRLECKVSGFKNVPSVHLILLHFFHIAHAHPLVIAIGRNTVRQVLPYHSARNRTLVESKILCYIDIFLRLCLFTQTVPILHRCICVFISRPILLFIKFLYTLSLFLCHSSTG